MDDDGVNACHQTRGKHSSGDLHSRLKTRKLLGVGETDDGDVHRSKLSQILGHSDQLYIRLPNGLRIWQIFLATILSILALWALLFPSHYFMTMYDVDGSTFTFPIRLYACALICISVMYWSTVQASDRDVIRMTLLSSVVFFTLQTCVTFMSMVTSALSLTHWSFLLIVMQSLSSLIGYYLHCGMGPRSGLIKRTSSKNELSFEKDQ
ncbi:tumor protein p53-inducible protein 11-like [Mya arenaria]|uniref:tumor protein p53-inducible protein 11-like n=1 Tax=Mya arenaria TaxID=6604 RepID=UPI0022E5DD52|nr:tumor protein p53-inducible protein 11-like [Mya arenaria]